MIFIFVEKAPALKKRVQKLGRKRLLKMPAALFTACHWWLFAARYLLRVINDYLLRVIFLFFVIVDERRRRITQNK
jgi:hypothetical protein